VKKGGGRKSLLVAHKKNVKLKKESTKRITWKKETRLSCWGAPGTGGGEKNWREVRNLAGGKNGPRVGNGRTPDGQNQRKKHGNWLKRKKATRRTRAV